MSREQELKDLMEALEKGKPRAPIGTKTPNGKFVKVGEGVWKPVGTQKPTHGVTVKFKHNGKEFNHNFGVNAQSHEHAWEQVSGKLKQLEGKIGKIDITHRNVHNLNKSYAENEMTGTNIDTTHHASEDMASRNSPWLASLKSGMDKFELGGQPSEMNLEFPYLLVAQQVDSGIYDGYVKNRDANSGEFGQVYFQIKKMTMPAMIEALKAKEYISDPPQPKQEDSSQMVGLLSALNAKLQPNVVNVNVFKSEYSELNDALIKAEENQEIDELKALQEALEKQNLSESVK